MKLKTLIVLFAYHLCFIVFAYQFRILKGISDAHYYWAQTFDIAKFSWFYFADYGTNFILFINYPFLKLGFPFWSGFLLYGIIGFFGIVQWIKWAELVSGEAVYFKGINVLYLLFLLPNLHVWTANLGKESIVFWGIASVFYAMAANKYKTFSFIAGSLLVIIIRPHVALMLLSAIALVFLFNKRQSLKKRLVFAFSAFSIVTILFYMVLQLTKIRYFDWDRIQYFNDFSIYSFRHSGTYIPMMQHNYGYRMFSLNFRPLFFDIHSFLGFFASLENSILLLIYILALFFLIKFYKKIVVMPWAKTAFVFTVIASLLYIQRYANLGIFMRTKIMYQPFMLIALFCIIKQGFVLTKSKT